MIAARKTVAAPSVRAAVYTRVSIADGLEKEFNSIDAQREACEAYVLSQPGAGWTALPARYDDGGFTGANTDRPAFQQLMADVESGKVDSVVVYKIDRLSRSLLDFTQLLATFKRHGVAFVSVTQSFDTSTPMGRMVVSLLATFAEFERETSAERVRDKVRAARRRGMWTGGRPVLGYDLAEKKLVVNQPEAERVREIFWLYREMGSLLRVVHELGQRGWPSKAWTNQDGKHVPGRPFTRTSLYSLLTNPVLVGKVRAGGDLADGQHEAIVDQATWDEVQVRLADKSVTPRGWRPPKRNGALLRGLLSCSCGASMIHHATRQHGRVYRFYVCAKALKLGAKACPGSRAPMGQLDAFVIERVRAAGRDPCLLAAAAASSPASDPATEPAEVQGAPSERGPTWAELPPRDRARALALLLDRVVFDAESGEVAITFRPGGPRLLGATKETA